MSRFRRHDRALGGPVWGAAETCLVQTTPAVLASSSAVGAGRPKGINQDTEATMHKFRFSLLAMFGFVAVISVACAALARPSQLWLVVVSAPSLACLFYAVLAATYGRNARRAFWPNDCGVNFVINHAFSSSG
jgi:hypothetical protein